MIVSLSSTTELNGQTASTSSTEADNILGKDAFLKLLVAQMAAQDPLDPMDNTEFSAQLAQFSTLEQMQNVNTNLESLITYEAAINNSLSINLIDKTVTVPANNLTISDGEPDSIFYELGKNAASVTIEVFDSGNNLVASILKKDQTVGLQEYTWDGKDSNGETLPDGDYTFEVSAIDSSEVAVATKTYQKSLVTGVVFENGISYVVTENSDEKIDLQDITSVNSSL